ncbi:hypothetical protein [Melittangium boletus]|uniref:hypothetical protein n=1 Tax=Melittangium boletus TaxID=83453 RepID=UPI001FE49810|nr:hypothetical protein [Melittangium boletus]
MKADDNSVTLQWRLSEGKTPDEALSSVKKRHPEYEWTGYDIHRSEVKRESFSLVGKSRDVARAAAKTAINYLAWRIPHLAYDPSLENIKNFIRGGGTSESWPKADYSEAFKGQLFVGDLKPVHYISVVSDESGLLRGGFCLFGTLHFYVPLTDNWRADIFHLEHQFEPLQRAHSIVDVHMVHPTDFSVHAERQTSRIQRANHSSFGERFLHERTNKGQWERCLDCCSPVKPPPTWQEVVACHRNQ